MHILLPALRASARFDALIADWGATLMSLLLRAYVGWQFFASGLVKLHDWDATLALFREEYHVPLLPPALAAVLGAGGELLLPLLLWSGLLTRPAALALFAVNAVAVLSYPRLFEFDCPAAINQHFYWGWLLLALCAIGPGRLALDALIRRKMRA
ncbi:DoxX family protein [Massilia sp. TS11]|uniref:DoxX family protein n=1 Tax=Massilia sp. TS11 TaxID=2908003 RepID=UPI001ED9D914|nr:DoxX family protein [Massilia sp. TS11]MCG2585646.1 DoxX family protein [Massilia sp. TS11]